MLSLLCYLTTDASYFIKLALFTERRLNNKVYHFYQKCLKLRSIPVSCVGVPGTLSLLSGGAHQQTQDPGDPLQGVQVEERTASQWVPPLSHHLPPLPHCILPPFTYQPWVQSLAYGIESSKQEGHREQALWWEWLACVIINLYPLSLSHRTSQMLSIP